MQSFRADLFGSWQYAKSERFEALSLLEFWAGLKGIHVLGTGGIINSKWQKYIQEHLVWDEETSLYNNKHLKDKRSRQKLFIDFGREFLPDFSGEQFLVEHVPPKIFFVPSGFLRLVWKKQGKKYFQNVWLALPDFAACLEFIKNTANFGELQVSGILRLNLSPRDFIEIIDNLNTQVLLCLAFENDAAANHEYTQILEDFHGHINYFDAPGLPVGMPGLETIPVLKSTFTQQPAQLGRLYSAFAGHTSYSALKNIACVCGAFSLEDSDNTACTSILPLQDILIELTGLKQRSRKLLSLYAQCLQRFGCEANILENLDPQDADKFLPFFGKALSRMRSGRFYRDGSESGPLTIFNSEERIHLQQGLGASPAKKQSHKESQGILLDSAFLDAKNQSQVNVSVTSRKSGKKKAIIMSELNKPQHVLEENHLPVGGGEDFIFASSPEEFLDKSAIGGLESKVENIQNQDPGTDKTIPTEDLPWNLDQVQSNIVFNPASPILVSAPAGAGKGRMLFARILHLLDEGISPHLIVAITPTRRAGALLDSALEQSSIPGSPIPRTDTIYALALELWHKTHGDVPVLLSEKNAKMVFAEVNSEVDEQRITKAFFEITKMRQTLSVIDPEYSQMAAHYAQHKNSWNLADYTDLLEFWKEQIDAGIYKNSWEHVLVDGVEDISPLEFYIIKALLSGSGEGFLGLGNFAAPRLNPKFCLMQAEDSFKTAWPGLQIFTLNTNYRSTPEILRISELFADQSSQGEVVRSALLSGRRPRIFSAPDPFAEAQWMAEQMNELLAEGFPANEIGVLIRVPSLLPGMAELLLQAGIPAQVAGQDAFWQDPRVDLILNMAGRMYGIDLGECGNEIRIECPDKIMARGPLAIAAYLSTVPPFTVDFWSSRAFRDLCKAYRTHRTWAGLLTWVGLNNEREFTKSKVFRVQVALGSLAKGLGFQAVFLPCMEDGLVPFVGEDMLCGRSNRPVDLADEKSWLRACIGMAEKRLYMSHAKKRVIFGKEYRLPASRFLEQIPKNYVVHTKFVTHEMRQESQLTLF